MRRVALIVLALSAPGDALAQSARPAFLEALCDPANAGSLRVFGAQPGESAEEARARLCGAIEAQPEREGPRFIRPRNRTAIPRDPGPPAATPPPRPSPRRPERPSAPGAQPAPRPPLDPESQDRVEQARRAFLEQLQRATQQGIIQPTEGGAVDEMIGALGPQNWTRSAERDPDYRPQPEPHAAYEPIETEIEAEDDASGSEEDRDWRRDQTARTKQQTEGSRTGPGAEGTEREALERQTQAPPPIPTPRPLPNPDDAFTRSAIRKLTQHLGRARAAGLAEFAAEGSPPHGEGPPPSVCIDDPELDVALWGRGEDYRSGVRMLRRRLARDPRTVRAEDALTLARHYIAWGAGDEARATLIGYDLGGRDARIVADLADVLRDRPPAPDGPLLGPETCEGRAALWRAAAFARLDPAKAAESYRDAGDVLMELPPHLRHILGPRIGLAALDAGDPDVADRLHRLLDRTPGPPDKEYTLFAAELAYGLGQRNQGVEAMLDLAADPSHVSWDAATRAAPRVAARPDAERAETLDGALGDLTFSMRDTVAGDSALESAARMRVFYDDLRGALEIIDAEAARRPRMETHWRGVARDIVAEAMAYSTPETSAAMFSALIEAAPRLDRSEVSAEARTRFARTLIGAGLPNLAEEMLPQWLVVQNTEAKALLDEARRMRAPAPAPDPPRRATVPEPEPAPDENALTGARELLRALDADLDGVKELVNDG